MLASTSGVGSITGSVNHEHERDNLSTRRTIGRGIPNGSRSSSKEDQIEGAHQMNADIKEGINIPSHEMFPTEIISSIAEAQDNGKTGRNSVKAADTDTEEDGELDE
jgi:hypothetical protein